MYVILAGKIFTGLVYCLVQPKEVANHPFIASIFSYPLKMVFHVGRIAMVYFAAALLCLLLSSTEAFLQLTHARISRLKGFSLPASTIESDQSEASYNIPKILPSAVGIDYVPLATMLATKDFLGADQFTRDNLIRISGAEAAGRNFVYWTEVKKIPKRDLITMEKLWLEFSQGNFGYSVQRRLWDSEKGNFDNFIRKIGWTITDNGTERKRKWFGNNEFIYDLEKAPKGHLPLTNALRGTQLIRQILTHPLWTEYDWKNYQNIPWE